MSSHAHLVKRYLRLRQIATNLNHKYVKSLGKDVMDEGGQRLGMLKGRTLVLGSEDELAVLMDYCIYNVHRGGRNAVERMLEEAPPSDPEERALLEAQTRAYYSLFRASAVEPGVGVTFQDLLRHDSIFVTDVGMGNSLREGDAMAGRVIPLDGYAMTGGAMLPVDKRVVSRLDGDMRRWLSAGTDFRRLTAADEAELAAQIIRACLEAGVSENMRYAEPGGKTPTGRSSLPSPGRVRANRNDPCPCGSGRKYRSCCGKR